MRRLKGRLSCRIAELGISEISVKPLHNQRSHLRQFFVPGVEPFDAAVFCSSMLLVQREQVAANFLDARDGREEVAATVQAQPRTGNDQR